MQIARSVIVPTFDQDRRVSAVSTRLEASCVLALQAGYTDVRCNGRDLDKGEICSGCDANAHGQSIDVVGDGSGAGAGARWSAGKDDGARGTRWPEAGRLPCIATYRLSRLAVSWLGFHPMSQHTLFEAASGLDLGYEYMGTRSSSIAALRLQCTQRREDAFANHLPSYSQLAEFATVRARRIHRQFTYASHRLPLYCDPSTEEGGDDKGRAGALIINGDMIQARFLTDGSGWVHGIYVVHLW
ncbi:hypothetical protein B0H13DRAFT_1851218 [Mycena leptocephala]|nr:hypothetical protein B0H13DRAFT_1851218 [Mycena leptocephala]